MKIICSAILLTTLFLFCVPNTNACSCAAGMQPDYEAWMADQQRVLFSGKVIKMEPVLYHFPNGEAREMAWKITFEIKKSWKNVKGEKITITTGNGRGDCGYKFKLDEEYFVDAQKTEKEIYTGICSWTQKLAQAKDIIQTLNQREQERPR